MNNQPTFKEYLNSRNGKVVMIQDGSFYCTKTNSNKLLKALFILLQLFLIVIVSVAIGLNFTWCNLFVDAYFLLLLLQIALKAHEYQHSRFERIDESDEIDKNSVVRFLTHTKSDRFAVKLFFSLIITFVFMSSFTCLYVRSLIEDDVQISDMHISVSSSSGDNVYFSDCENISKIDIPINTIANIKTYFYISGKPDSYQIKLNGCPQTELYNHKYFGFMFSENIFVQDYYVSFDASDLPKDSVLEISSGSYSRQWTIKIE